MKQKTLGILLALTALGVGAAYFATRARAPEATSASSTRIFPTLSTRINDITEIVVKRPGVSFTIQKDGDTWRVMDKAGFPAKFETVRSFTIALSELREVEPKTDKPELYSKLGVEDPTTAPASPAAPETPASQSALVTLKDAKGETVAAAILGNPKWGTTPGIYIRRAGEALSWLAEGKVDLQREPLAWIDTQFANIKKERVKSVVITHPGSETLTVSHEKQADKLEVKDIPPGRELKDPGVGDSIAGVLSGLTMQDVVPIATIDFTASGSADAKPGPSIELRTFDGLIVNIQSISRDGRAWWKLAASVDEAIASQGPTPAPENSVQAPAATSLEALKKEAADLNTRWSPYAFAPADWKAKSVNNTMGDLLKDPTPPTPAPSAEPTGP